MDFNFDEITDRRNTHSIKWDANPSADLLPLWIADMDFKSAPAILEALQKRLHHGIFGYTEMPPLFYNAVTNWWKKRYNFKVEKEWLVPVPGVIMALSAAIESLSKKGDKIILQSPVYNHFYMSILNSGREILENKLLYNDGNYAIDFEDLAQKASQPDVKLMIISNPHNPVGKVWSRDELQKIGDICLQNNVIVISDEIHADLVFGENVHIPFASLGEIYSTNSVTLGSPSKSFNLAGLQVGYFFSQNNTLKTAVDSSLKLMGMELLNLFAIEALIAAYEESEQWLDALKVYIYQNYLLLKEFIETHLPTVKVIPLESTYLVWLDCSAITKSSDELAKQLLDEQQLWINSGTMYGSGGEGFIRINIATSAKVLQSGLERLKKGLS